VVSFGDPVEDVMVVLTDLFGPPSSDQLYESPFDVYDDTGPDRGPEACNTLTGYFCFDYIRHVSWGDVGLGVTFSDLMVNDDGYWRQVPPNLRGYSYGAGDTGPTASTVHGITVGSTVKDLQALGDEVTFGYDDCGGVVVFSINYSDSTSDGRINGYLLGTDSEAFSESGYVNPDATVLSLSAGAQSSC
jgi:hypothetical protein